MVKQQNNKPHWYYNGNSVANLPPNTELQQARVPLDNNRYLALTRMLNYDKRAYFTSDRVDLSETTDFNQAIQFYIVDSLVGSTTLLATLIQNKWVFQLPTGNKHTTDSSLSAVEAQRTFWQLAKSKLWQSEVVPLIKQLHNPKTKTQIWNTIALKTTM